MMHSKVFVDVSSSLEALSPPRSPSMPVDDIFHDADRKYLQFLPKLYGSRPETTPVQLVGVSFREWKPTSTCAEFIFPWPTFPLASKVFRYAFLAFCSQFVDPGPANPDTFPYLAKFYKYMQQAINVSSFSEVVVASYAILCYVSLGSNPEPLKTLLAFFNGMIQGQANITSSDQCILTMMQDLQRWSLLPLQGGYWLQASPTSGVSDEEYSSLWELHKSLQRVERLPRFVDHNFTAKSISERLTTLDVYLRFYLDHYLALRQRQNFAGEINQRRQCIVDALQQIVVEITYQVPRLAEPRKLLDLTAEFQTWPWTWNSPVIDHGNFISPIALDLTSKRQCLLYGLARVVGDALLVSEGNHISNLSSAITLSRICALALDQSPLPSPISALPYIFWAGLKISKAVDAPGMHSPLIL